MNIRVHKTIPMLLGVLLAILICAACLVVVLGSQLPQTRTVLQALERLLSQPSAARRQIISSTLPVAFVWEFNADDTIWDPIVVGNGGAVFVKAGQVVCALDPVDGHVRWKHRTGTASSSIIAPYQDMVLVGSHENSVLTALREGNGAVVWAITLTQYLPLQMGVLPSIVEILTTDERVYLAITQHRGGQAFAFDAHTGRLIWQSPPEFRQQVSDVGSILDGQSRIGIRSGANHVVFLDKVTGKIDRIEEYSFESVRSLTYLSGTAYISGKAIRAIDIERRRELWRFSPECKEVSWVSPEVSRSVVYIPICGRVYALNAVDGRLLWQYAHERGGDSFKVLADYGYLLTDDAVLHALDLRTGREVGRLTTAYGAMPFEARQYLSTGGGLLLTHFGGRQLLAFHTR